jgi:hypothetical protein
LLPKDNMTDRKELFIKALNVSPASVEALSEDHFRVGLNEFRVWTDEEAAGFAYFDGGVETLDVRYKVYRIK